MRVKYLLHSYKELQLFICRKAGISAGQAVLDASTGPSASLTRIMMEVTIGEQDKRNLIEIFRSWPDVWY